jgi:hypothetical protein
MEQQSPESTMETYEMAKQNQSNARCQKIAMDSLADTQKVLLPPLHIKLCLMKQFVKALQRDGKYFKYPCRIFPACQKQDSKKGFFV